MARLTPDQLRDTLVRELDWYAGTSDDFRLYFAKDDEQRLYMISGIRNAPQAEQERSFILMQARVVDDHIVIDEDTLWDKNLWQALENASVPREQIILAYKGEKLPSLDEAT